MIMDTKTTNKKFNINEIFYSLQGEGTRTGLPCVFVRLQGCELRCKWCDTPDALDLKKEASILTANEIYNEIKNFDCNYITFTGGEPLLQKGIEELINSLAAEGYTVAVETNGHQDISVLDDAVIKIMDLKAPGSAMELYNNYKNLTYLSDKDEIKIVISDENDYKWAKEIILKEKLHKLVNSVILIPAFNAQIPKKLAKWILDDKLPVRMMLQMHKYIWGADTKGV